MSTNYKKIREQEKGYWAEHQAHFDFFLKEDATFSENMTSIYLILNKRRSTLQTRSNQIKFYQEYSVKISKLHKKFCRDFPSDSIVSKLEVYKLHFNNLLLEINGNLEFLVNTPDEWSDNSPFFGAVTYLQKKLRHFYVKKPIAERISDLIELHIYQFDSKKLNMEMRNELLSKVENILKNRSKGNKRNRNRIKKI